MPTVRKQTASVRRTRTRKVKTGSVVDRITELQINDGIKINIYGRSGTGKTRIWSTFPKPILAMVCSGGNKPGELRSINTKENRKTIKSVVIEKGDELFELVEMQKNGGPYATLVLDHVTGLQDLALKEILGLEELPAQASWGLATQQQYGQLGIQVKSYLRSLLSLSCNIVIIGQEREFNTDNESELIMPYVASALSPSIVGWLNPACDYICQTFIREQTVSKTVKVGNKERTKDVSTGEVEYCLRTGPDPVYTTKFRVPPGTVLPNEVVDADFSKIAKLIGV